MAIIKCKMCGGDLDISEGMSVAECEYCGTKQTVPSADSEKKLTLFGRANRLRQANEFDKAAGVYESIVAEFPEEAEAYWGLVLCRYGIEYVDDPATGKKIPTCHRSSFDSILEDSDFEQACENADAVARKVYREEAKVIEDIRKGILEVSGKEEPYDIFICYKETDENGERTLDSVMAQDVYDALTEKGYRVFFSRISLEDKLGTEYEPYIFAALNSAKVMLAFGTDYEYFNAVWVKNEWSRFLALIAGGQKKTLIPCYKGIDAYDMPKEFAKLQAQDLGKVGATQDLLRGIEKILSEGPTAVSVPAAQPSGGPSTASLLERGMLCLEDGDWSKAQELFDQVLNIDPKCAEAYLGLHLVHGKCTKSVYEQRYVSGKESEESANIRRTKEYAGEALQAWFEQLEQKRHALEEEKRKKSEQKREELAPIRKKVETLRGILITRNKSTVGVQSDGTVVTAGETSDYYTFRGGFTSCSSAEDRAVCVRVDDTTVDMRKYSGYGVSKETNIVAVAECYGRLVGLRADGTVMLAKKVVGAGENYFWECSVSGWTDIVAIAVGADSAGIAALTTSHVVGLRADGTVVATGSNRCGQCNVAGWTDVVAVDAGPELTVGLKADGTVVATGSNFYGQCNVAGWSDIVAITVDKETTFGLRTDGTVLATKANYEGQYVLPGWSDIVTISAGGMHIVGLCSDGKVVALGSNRFGQCNVTGWKLFHNVDTLKRECEVEKEILQTELANLKGLFNGIRRKEIEARLERIDYMLKRLQQ